MSDVEYKNPNGPFAVLKCFTREKPHAKKATYELSNASPTPGLTNQRIQQSRLSIVCAPSKNHVVPFWFGSGIVWQRPGHLTFCKPSIYCLGRGTSGSIDSWDSRNFWASLMARLAFDTWWVPASPVKQNIERWAVAEQRTSGLYLIWYQQVPLLELWWIQRPEIHQMSSIRQRCNQVNLLQVPPIVDEGLQDLLQTELPWVPGLLPTPHEPHDGLSPTIW